MNKLFICLLFIAYVVCDDEGPTFNKDEVDITTRISNKAEIEPATNSKQKPNEFSDESAKGYKKYKQDTNTEDQEALTTPVVETQPKEIDRKDENSEEKHQKTNGDWNAKEKDVKESDPPNDEKTGSESNVDLGKDYKKFSIKEKNRENNNNDYNRGFNTEDKETVGTGAEDTGSRMDVFEDKAKKPDDKYGSERDYEDDKGVAGSGGKDSKAVNNGNEIIDELLVLMKQGFRSEFDKVKLEDVAPIKHGRWGSITLHSGILSGLANVERVGAVLIQFSEENNKKLIIGDIAINNVYTDYKVNAKLFHRISIKDRDLKLSLRKAVLNIVLEVDSKEKKLLIRELELKSTEGFGVKSGRLFWPFNKLTDAILKSQEQVIKGIIKAEISKYMGKVVHNIKFEDVFAKLF